MSALASSSHEAGLFWELAFHVGCTSGHLEQGQASVVLVQRERASFCREEGHSGQGPHTCCQDKHSAKPGPVSNALQGSFILNKKSGTRQQEGRGKAGEGSEEGIQAEQWPTILSLCMLMTQAWQC